MDKLQADDGPNPFNIFILLSVALVAIAMLVFAGLAIARVTGLTDTSNGRERGPYGVLVRPMPDFTQVKDVLPEQYGDFKRGPIAGTIDDFKATYTKGDLKIALAGASAINIRAAQASVSDVARTVGSANGAKRQLDQDPSYYLTTGEGPIRYVWSHGHWFFDITASSQQALDAFMRVFPY